MRAFDRIQTLHPCVKTAMVFSISGFVVPIISNLYYLYVSPSGAGTGFVVLCPPCMAEMGFEYMPSPLDRAAMFALITVVNGIIWAAAGATLWILVKAIGWLIRSLRGPGEEH